MNNSSPTTARNPALDGARGLAVLLVLFWHYIPCSLTTLPPSTPFYFLLQMTVSTKTGVDLFFVLSGYLICGIILDHQNASNFFRVFYRRRICRIFPLYFALLFFCVAVTPFVKITAPFFYNLFRPDINKWPFFFFLQNFVHVPDNLLVGSLSVTWSIAVEEQFYLVMPALVFFLPRKWLARLLVLAVLVAPLAALLLHHSLNIVNPLARCDGLAWGCLLALASRNTRCWTQLGARKKLIAGIGIGACLLAWIWPLLGFQSVGLFDSLHSFAYCALVFMIMNSARLAKCFSHPVLVRAGVLSYGLYLLHLPVLYTVFSVQASTDRKPFIYDQYDVALVCLSLVITWVLSALIYRFYESPIINWGHRIKYADQ